MKLNQLFMVGVILSSAYIIGCGSKFESSVVKAKGKAVAPGESASISNTTTGATVPAMCSASISVAPDDLKVLVDVQGVKKDLSTIQVEELNTIHTEFVEIQGFFETFETPQLLNLTLNETQKTVAMQTFKAYTGTADNNYSMDYKVQGQCLLSLCQSYLLVIENQSTDHSCEGTKVQLVIYKTTNEPRYSYSYVGRDLSFEEIKSLIAD